MVNPENFGEIMSSWNNKTWFSIRVYDLETIDPFGRITNQYVVDNDRHKILRDIYDILYGITVPMFNEYERPVV